MIVEFTPEQLVLLEKAEARHGTKRAGIVAALAAYATPAPSHAEPSQTPVRAKPDKAQAAKLRAAEDALAAAQAEVSTLRVALARAETDTSDLEKRLAHADRVRIEIEDAAVSEAVELNEAIDELRAQLIDVAYCARCGDWVPDTEWTWTRDVARGEYAYHTSCCDHGSGLLAGSRVVRRRT